MLLQVVESYPPGTATGCCYLSALPQGDITEAGPDGPIVRRELVMNTGVDVPFEGTLCIGERTVRWMAQLLGMYDHWAVDRLEDAVVSLTDERDLLSRELANARQHVENLMEAERDRVAEVFVAADGTRHASLAAAVEEGRRGLGLPPASLANIAPIGPPAEPEPEAESKPEPPATGIKAEAQKAAARRKEAATK